MTHSHFTPNHFIRPSNIQPKTHTHTHAHKPDSTRLVETREEKCCWGKECTYFLCSMTIVINVQAIRHCHWRTYTAALKDLAISINVLCPSVAMSSFPLNSLAAMWYCVSFTYSWTVSQRCPVETGDNGTFRLPFSYIVLLWVNRACVCSVLVFFFFCRLHSRLSFSEAREKQIQK